MNSSYVHPYDESNFEKPREGTFLKPEMVSSFDGGFFITDRGMYVTVRQKYCHHKWRYEGVIKNPDYTETFDIWDVNGYSPDSGTIIGYADKSDYHNSAHKKKVEWGKYSEYNRDPHNEEKEFLKHKKRCERY